MNIHRLLSRQLSKIQLNLDNPPSLVQWREFISRVNKTYQEADQERYLLERSMDISSREMMELNEKLEKAQHTAGMGYWHFDKINNYIFCSNEVYAILSIDPLNYDFTYEAFLSLVHADDRPKIIKMVKESDNNEVFEFEARIINSEGVYRWYRVIINPQDTQKMSGVVIDINKDKQAEEKIRELNQKLLVTARRAGMSEVATSILHNIGNILNSSNISINVLKENINQSYYPKIIALCSMLQAHRYDMASYLVNDEKGKIIPEYLTALMQRMEQEWERNSTEVNSIDQDLQHIKTIVAMQQIVSGVDGVKEKIYIPELIETALQMSTNKSQERAITFKKFYVDNAYIVTDKSKLLQILVNLIQNAKDAVANNSNEKSPEIIFVVDEYASDKISILVEDNGVGILAENLTRIFSFGFTTKKNGHGFGLHSCALSAQDMGGALRAESKGMGEGAKFIVTLPIVSGNREKGVFNE